MKQKNIIIDCDPGMDDSFLPEIKVAYQADYRRFLQMVMAAVLH